MHPNEIVLVARVESGALISTREARALFSKKARLTRAQDQALNDQIARQIAVVSH